MLKGDRVRHMFKYDEIIESTVALQWHNTCSTVCPPLYNPTYLAVFGSLAVWIIHGVNPDCSDQCSFINVFVIFLSIVGKAAFVVRLTICVDY